MKKKLALILAALMVLVMPMSVLATEPNGGTTEITTEISTEISTEITTEVLTSEETEEAILSNDNTPILCLGADLNDSQLSTVLSLMGITKDDMADYKVLYVTNAEEHQFLDGYIDSSIIGKRALSSVMIKPTDAGNGIRVTSKNINYCTISMYKNALLTAGVENADVLVCGPFEISGTAALIGAWKAYEEMSGETLTDEAKDTALDELVTNGEIMEGFSAEEVEKVQELMNYVKAEVISQGLTDPEKIKEIIKEAEKQFDIDLSDEQIQMIIDLMKKIANLDIDPQKLMEQAGDMYNKYKGIIDSVLTDEVKASIWDAIVKFFQSLFNAIFNK